MVALIIHTLVGVGYLAEYEPLLLFDTVDQAKDFCRKQSNIGRIFIIFENNKPTRYCKDNRWWYY